MYLANPLTAANCYVRGDTLYFMEDFQSAEDEYKKLLKSENTRDQITGRERLISLYRIQGRFNDIFELVESCNENLKPVGTVFDIFGPLSSPYIAVKPHVQNPEKLVNHVLYATPSKAGRKKRKKR